MLLYVKECGTKYLCRNGKLYEDNSFICNLLTSSIVRFLSRFRLFSRLLRLEPRCAVFLNDCDMLIAFQHKIFMVSTREHTVNNIILSRIGFSHPLNFLSMLEFGKEEIYWGDYGDNCLSEEINIYKYTKEKGAVIVFTFAPGIIKHVHNIIYDKWRDRFFVLTGDFGEKVGIYTADRDFKKVEPFLIGREDFRAVQGVVFENCIAWVTDAVLHENHLFYYDFNSKELKKKQDINGSVIYGCSINDGLLFSTTVEPFPSSSSRILSLLDNRLGPGIKSKHVHLLYMSDKLEVTKICEYKKDVWPMRLFQYGQIMFPYYEEKKQKSIIVNPVAVKNVDGKQQIIKLNNIN